MDLELDEDQEALIDAVRTVVEQECPPGVVRQVVETGVAASPLWQTYVDLDWPLLAVPETAGGMGYGPIELTLVLEELGRVADPTPYLASVAMFVPAVLNGAEPERHASLLSSVASGTETGALAITDPRFLTATEHLPQAARNGDGWQLDGAIAAVLDGGRADQLVVVANNASTPELFLVPASQVETRRVASFDASLHVADVHLQGVTVPDTARLAASGEAAHQTVAHAVVALASSMVGTCQRIVDLTVAYARERHQFGVPIGSFQAVKHKLVDMHMAVERARATVLYAALVLADGDSSAPTAASMAKAAAGDAQRRCAQDGLQLFGGIGYTWEHDLHLYLRRAKAGGQLLGTASTHRAAVAADLLRSDPTDTGAAR